MTDRWHVTVDRTACIGSGVCVGTAPGAFTLVDDHSEPIGTPRAHDDLVVLAAENCPAAAISVVDAGTGVSLIDDVETK